MAEKKANPSGVSTKVVRQTAKNSSVFVLLQIKFEEWQKVRANRRRSQNRAKAKAAKALGIPLKAPAKPKAKKAPAAPKPTVPADPKKKNDRLAKALIIALLVLALLASILTWVWFLNQPLVPSTTIVGVPVGSPTPTVQVVPAVVGSPTTVVASESAYLRVETLQLDTAYGIWRRMENVPVFLSPYRQGEAGPDPSRQGTLRQVTEELRTTDGILVAATTFETSTGYYYWVWVDEASLPAGCAVWVPRFNADSDSGISVMGPVVVGLSEYGEFNTPVVKFQIICGQEVSVSSNSVVPVSTPVPTNPPPTNPPPTEPPPTEPPPPTVEPTEVICNCETPSTPVPTPTPMDATATPSR